MYQPLHQGSIEKRWWLRPQKTGYMRAEIYFNSVPALQCQVNLAIYAQYSLMVSAYP